MCDVGMYDMVYCLQFAGLFLPTNHPGAMLSQFSSPISDEAQNSSKAAYAALYVAKSLKHRQVQNMKLKESFIPRDWSKNSIVCNQLNVNVPCFDKIKSHCASCNK